MVKNPSANVGDISDAGLIPGLGRFPGEGNGNPLQYSCLENAMDRGAWRQSDRTEQLTLHFQREGEKGGKGKEKEKKEK